MSIPKDPRQLMINIMYLVLTALLALNVSAEIFNAFEMVDKGLEAANNSLDASNAALPVEIKDRAKKREAYQVYADRVDVARQYSTEINQKIDEMVLYMIDQTGNKNGLVDEEDYRDNNGKQEIRGKRDFDITTRYLVDQGNGEQLRELLLDYKSKFLDLIDEDERASFISKIPIEIDDDSWRQSRTKRKSWADFTFNHMPLAATLPIFSKFKNDIKSSEATILNYLLGKVGGEDVVLDQFRVVASPKKSYVIKGETYEADIFLSAAAGKDVNTGININVNGRNLAVDKEGVARFRMPANSVGRKNYNASVTVTNPVTGDVNTYKSNFEFEVGERSVTVSPTKMNVFYIGVDNPVEVSAAGVSSNDMSVSMGGNGGGTIKRNGDGTFTVNVSTPTRKGEFAKVNVSAGGMSASKDFRVKRIPDPTPMIGQKRGGAMGSGEFKLYESVRAVLSGFDFDAKCDIRGFRMVYAPRRQDPQISTNPGGKFNQDSQRLAAQAKPGDRYFFENIKCACPGDRAPRDIGYINIVIN